MATKGRVGGEQEGGSGAAQRQQRSETQQQQQQEYTVEEPFYSPFSEFSRDPFFNSPFRAIDRLYRDMMENVDRVHSQMDTLYNWQQQQLPFYGYTSPDERALLTRPWWRPSSYWLQQRGRGGDAPAITEGDRSSSTQRLATTGDSSQQQQLQQQRAGERSIQPYFFPYAPALWREGSRGGSAFMGPRVDVKDCGDEFLVKADVPGFSKENVKVSVERGVLRLSGVQQQQQEQRRGSAEEGAGFYLQERYNSSFSRSIPLPEKVKEQDIRASMVDGVLQVHIPKAEPSNPARSITIE